MIVLPSTPTRELGGPAGTGPGRYRFLCVTARGRDTARVFAVGWGHLGRVAIALVATQVVVFLWYAPYMAKFVEDDSRLAYLWEPADTVSLIGGMVALVMACTLAGAALRRLHKPALTRVFNHLFVIALAGGLLNNIAFHCTRERGYSIGRDGVEMATAWLGVMMLVGYSLARPEWGLVRRCRQFCLITSPGVLIVFAQLLRPVYYRPAYDPLPVAPAAASLGQNGEGAGPVYAFIFDEWSYRRTFEDGRVRDALPHLRALSQRAVVFQDAHSPSPNTDESIPQTLFQTKLRSHHDHGRVGFKRDGQFVEGERGWSLFSLVPADYDTIMVGFGLPYAPLLGGEVDVCRSYKGYMHGQSMLAKTGIHLLHVMGTSTDPWSRFVYGKVVTRLNLKYAFAVDLHQRTERDMVDILSKGPRKTFAVMHHRLPHGPYIYAADGSYTGPTEDIGQHTAEAYQRNLKQLDRLTGKLVGLMEQRGTFDDALVIVTSDHTWRTDPAMELTDESVTHVPLMVKLPHQRRPEQVSGRFETWRLGRLIQAALVSNGDPQVLQPVIEQAANNAVGCPTSSDAGDSMIAW